MGQIKFISSIMLIALFSIAIITFAINFASDNDASINLADDSNFTTISSNLKNNASTQFFSDVNVSSEAMYESTVNTQVEATEGGTSFKVGPGTALIMAKDTLSIGFNKIFGADSSFSVFLTALLAILGYTAIMLLYKAWAGRNP